MITENLSTLKIHKLSQAQYERELAAGRIDENALYLTPDTYDGSNVFATTTPTATPNTSITTLPGAGWYYISINVSNAEYNFGLMYWDGSSSFKMASTDGYTINFSAGYPIVYKDGNTFYSAYTLHVAKLS